MELKEATVQFVNDVCVGKTNLTPDAYHNKLLYLRVYIGDDTPMDNISNQDIIDFQKYFKNRNTKRRGSTIVSGHISPFTIRNALITIRYFLRWCHEKSITNDNFMSVINIPKLPKPEPKAVRKDTVLALLELAATTGFLWCRPRNIAIIYLLRDTGGRLGALALMDVDNLDLQTGRIYTKTKGDNSITLRLTDTTVQAIKNWLPVRNSLHPLDHKLLTNRQRVGLAPQGIYRAIYTLTERGEIVGRSNPHAFRHAFARDLLRNGADLSTVSQLMGHSSIQTTADYYARWADDELQISHNKFSPVNDLPLINPQI